jgi:hypothetical protein
MLRRSLSEVVFKEDDSLGLGLPGNLIHDANSNNNSNLSNSTITSSNAKEEIDFFITQTDFVPFRQHISSSSSTPVSASATPLSPKSNAITPLAQFPVPDLNKDMIVQTKRRKTDDVP